MLRLAVFLLLALVFRSAHAVIDYQQPGWKLGTYDTPLATAEAACQYNVPNYGRVFDYVGTVSGTKPNRAAQCFGHLSGSPPSLVTTVGESCAANYSWVSSRDRCERTLTTCPAGKQVVGQYCEPIPPCTANQTVGSGYIRQGTDPNRMASLQCSGQCEVVFDGFTGAGSTLEAGVKVYYGMGKLITTGSTCTQGTPLATTPAASVPAPACASGEVLGQVNGKPVCAKRSGTDAGVAQAPSASASQASTTQVVNNPDGTTTTTTTDTTGVRNADGSTGSITTITTRTCDTAGNCSSTADTTTKGEVKPDEGQSECERNPDAAMCQKLDTPPTPDLPGLTVNVSVAPQSGWGPDNGTCPALVHTASIGNVDVFGLFCQYAAGIRFAVIGFAGIMAALIVLGRTD